MFEHKIIQDLDEYFLKQSGRKETGVYFYRINGYSERICGFVRKYFDAARVCGVVIEGKIPNPDERQLAYYSEIMGETFQMSVGFIRQSLAKWLPRMNGNQQENVAVSIYDTLNDMRRMGKNDNILKNAYIKFMCWLYYKFERIVNCLGAEQLPKILYEGEVSNYELKLLCVLSKAGCDIVLLQYHGDLAYLKLDPKSETSMEWTQEGLTAFPEWFHLKWIQQESQRERERERIYGGAPEFLNATNVWIQGTGLTDIKTGISARGDDPKLFYNCFIRICGVEDKLTYMNELYQFQLELKAGKRNLLVLDGQIPKPSMEEIAGIRRGNYGNFDSMLADLSSGIQYSANLSLQKLMRKAFLDVMFEAQKLPDMNVNKLTNKAVYLLCWLKRYQGKLFSNWKIPQIGCVIFFNACKNENEALFLKMLARLPADVLLLSPDQNERCIVKDKLLYEIQYGESMSAKNFPAEESQIRMSTAAYQAERELDSLMYEDSGLYRNRQYEKANAVSLKTTYEEIAILWNEELQYRPNFSTIDAAVNAPVLFAKVSGVKDGQKQQYWADIKELITKDAIVVKQVPYIRREDENPIKPYAAEFLKNGKAQKAKIKAHKAYRYSFLREEIQDYILDKLQLLLDQRIIKGTYENGTEYTIVSAVLNLKQEIIRLLQNFDFTKKNPKLIYIHTSETAPSLEDAVMAAFLNLAGFDVLVFTPTGYQSIENFYTREILEEHQIGEYMYDLSVPNFDRLSFGAPLSWYEKIFKRGR